MTPQRIQLRRTKGWRKPEGAVVVARPSRWGNCFRVGDMCQIWHKDCSQDARPGDMTRDWFMVTRADQAVSLYRACIVPDDRRWTDMQPGVPDIETIRRELAGKDLACWCPLTDAAGNRVPCHADVLLELANPGWMPRPTPPVPQRI